MKEFEEYLRRIGKSENTALTYCRNIRMYFSWCRDSFGSEPKELYRSNVLEYISYMRNIRGYSPKSVNNHLSALRCLNKYLVQIGRQSDMAVLDSDFMKVQIQYASRQCAKLSASRINQIFNQYSDTIMPKTLRHFFCSNALENSYSIHEVANQAGHSNVQTTLIYSNPSAKQMKEKANKL